MNLLKLSLLLILLSNISWSQTPSNPYNRPFVIFESCEDATDMERCYEIKLHKFIGKHLNNKPFRDSIFFKAKKDTITIYSSISYDEKGGVIKEFSSLSNPIAGKNNFKESVLDSIPNVLPVLDTNNNGVSSQVNKLFGFLLNKSKEKIVPIFGYTPNEVPFAIIETLPVYRGCKKKMSNIDLKKCMNDKINKLVSKNFDIKLASNLGLSPGLKRIFVQFKIDKKGEVTSIKARVPHLALETEAIRVIKKIPQLKSPGYQ